MHSSQCMQAPNKEIRIWVYFSQNENNFSHMSPSDFRGRRTTDFCGISMTNNYRINLYLHDTKVKISETSFHYLHAGSAKYHVERPTTENVSSVLSSSQKQIVSRITRSRTATHILNYSSCSGSPFQNRNSRSRKGNKMATVMRSLEWLMYERFNRQRVFNLENWEGTWKRYIKSQIPWKRRTIINFFQNKNNRASNRIIREQTH